MKNFFNLIAPIYEQMQFGDKKTFRKIESLGDFRSTDDVLDLGGGSGRIAKFLINKVQKMTVVDSSQKMIEQCQKRTGLSCVFAESENLPFANNSIDRIIIVDAFHHFNNQERAIQEIKRVLTQNGKVVIEEFNPAKIGGRFVMILETVLRLGSVFHTPPSLAQLFSNNGLNAQIFDAQRKTYYLVADKQ